MKEAASQNQRVLTHIQACNSPQKDTIQNKHTGQSRNLSLQSGLNSSSRASPNENDNSYVKEMWPTVAASSDGITTTTTTTFGQNKPMSPVYQAQNIKPRGQFTMNATLDRAPRSNVRFRDDMSIQSSTRSANHLHNDQHIYESPDGVLRSYNAISSNHSVPNTTNTLPRNLNSNKLRNQKDPSLKYKPQVEDTEDVWRRRSSKTESVLL